MRPPFYPNLELIQYKVERLMLVEDDKLCTELGHRWPDFEAIVFPQTWGNTCTGFDVLSDESPAYGGCAMTKEYTTVLHELETDSYFVCFGNRPCYKVTEPNEAFYADLNARQMASLSEAKKRY